MTTAKNTTTITIHKKKKRTISTKYANARTLPYTRTLSKSSCICMCDEWVFVCFTVRSSWSGKWSALHLPHHFQFTKVKLQKGLQGVAAAAAVITTTPTTTDVKAFVVIAMAKQLQINKNLNKNNKHEKQNVMKWNQNAIVYVCWLFVSSSRSHCLNKWL